MKYCGDCKRWIVENSFQTHGKCEIIGVGRTKYSNTCSEHCFGQQKTIFGLKLPDSSTKQSISNIWGPI